MLHLGDGALVQHHAADELHVVVALLKRALGRFAHRGEGRHENVVKRLPGGQFRAELGGAGAQLLVAELGDLAFQRIDGVDPWPVTFHPAIVDRTEQLLCESAKHAVTFLIGPRGAEDLPGSPQEGFSSVLRTHTGAGRRGPAPSTDVGAEAHVSQVVAGN